ncbi:MAG: TrmB family transcriptional regulator [Halanaeroarchaeum sp.]
MTADDPSDLLETLELREYEMTAVEHLLRIGRTTAPNLSEATGIPRARIYDILSSLSERGFVEEIPGRPKQYQPKSPSEILDRAIENRRQSFESYRATIEERRSAFLETFEPLFEQASEDTTPTEDLFHVVDVGDPSETETRLLYQQAEREVHVLTKGFEYFDAIRPAFEDAYDRGVPIRILMLDPTHLSADNRAIQAERYDSIQTNYPDVEVRFSAEKLPIRGTIVDPSMNYEEGRAIILVEEKDIPLSMRQAAITENGSFVAGLDRYFELIWDYDSREDP